MHLVFGALWMIFVGSLHIYIAAGEEQYLFLVMLAKTGKKPGLIFSKNV